ncbi:MAG TPA: RluA family pseudouridine synthase [Vicinamibacterales bacterium]|nr:RluA family pseudouridine synthase [Vicinamibacterales bacterium]
MADTEWPVGPADAGLRLDKFLASADRIGSRARAFAALERGKVFVNGAEMTAADAARRVGAGDAVRVWMDRPGSAKPQRGGPQAVGDLEILFEDAVLIVIDKPAGLLTVPLERKAAAPSVQSELERYLRGFGKRRPLVVHRIDQDTSGLVVFAKDAGTQARLKAQFKRRAAERVYLAVVYGHPSPAEGRWRDHLVWDEKALIQKETHPRDPRAQEAVSDYRVRERYRDTSLIEVRLHSGRRNQIRVQARLRGHTLVGEKRYTFGPDGVRPIQFERHALHAWRLAFDHPQHGARCEFEAPLPPDFNALLERLRS